MKSTEIKTLLKGTGPNGSSPDRLTLLLVGLATLLLASAVVLVIDILLSSKPDGQMAEAPSIVAAAPPATAYPAISIATATPTAGTPPPCVVPHDWGIHIVQGGDTLYSLAEQSGTDFPTLKRVNCLQRSDIWIGQQLYVPGPLALPTYATPTVPAALALTATPLSKSLVVSEALTANLPVLPVQVPIVEVPTPTIDTAPGTSFRFDGADQYLNTVLLGADVRPHKKNITWRTDAIVIVSVDLERNTIRLLHVPRDLWVYIPGYGHNRINTADLWGEIDQKGQGPEWVKQTIHHNLGIPIHYYVKVGFQGFVDIIDTLGGVVIDVSCPLPEPELNLEPGMHRLDGKMALEYVHSRETSSDFDRGRRQRKMLMALWEQHLTPEIIPKLPKLWVQLSDSYETDIPLDQAISLAALGLRLDPQDISQKSISRNETKNWITPEGFEVLRPKKDDLRTMLEEYYAPDDTVREDKLRKVRVRVLNGSSRREAEELSAAQLRRVGFKIVETGEADHKGIAETQIIIHQGDPAAGEKVARTLGVPITSIQDETAIPEPPDPANKLGITVILGQDYDPCQR